MDSFGTVYETGSSNPNDFLRRETTFTSMIGSLTPGKKAAKFDYKRYGILGADVAGVGAAIGAEKLPPAYTKNNDT
jgi:hypothetical protein